MVHAAANEPGVYVWCIGVVQYACVETAKLQSCGWLSRLRSSTDRGVSAVPVVEGPKIAVEYFALIYKILTGCGGSVSLLVRPRFTLLYFALILIDRPR